jgi:hypothetical protein
MLVNYLKYYPWGGEANFQKKILSKEKIHTIRKNKKGFKPNAVLDHGERIKGKGFKRKSFSTNKCISVQEIEITFKKDEITKCEINGKSISWKLIAENDGLSSNDFLKWFSLFKNEENKFTGYIVHWSHFKY